MLTAGDRTYVIEKLSDRLAGLDARLTLSSVLPPACMGKIPYLQYPTQYAIEAVNVCARDRWNNRPPWIVLLLDVLLPEAETVALRAKLANRPSEPHPTQANVLATESPFVNRSILRQKTDRLIEERTPRPILLVTGEPKSGKSYTAEYINHLYLSGGEFDYCHVKLPRGNGLTWGPEQLAKDILVNMGVNVAALSPSFLTNDTNNERWPHELAGRVLAEGKGLGTRYWILLDDFVGVELREDTRKFISALAERIDASTVFSKSFRLVLLGFDRASLTVAPTRVDVETITTFGVSDVGACVTEIFTRIRGLSPAAEVQPVVTRILTDLPNGEARMAALNQRLVYLMEELRARAHA